MLKRGLSLIFAGVLIGAGMIIPGVSGGVMAISFGIYERIIAILAHPFRNLHQNLKFAVPLVLGAVISILVLSNVLDYLLMNYPLMVMYLFVGLVIGSLPALVKIASKNGFNRRYYLSFFVGIALMIAPLLLTSLAEVSSNDPVNLNYNQIVISGILLAVGTVVPGVSSSFLLIIFGTYQTLLHGLANFDLWLLIPVAIPFIISVLVLSRLTNYFLQNFYGWTYYALLGIIVGSIAVVFPGLPATLLEGIVCVFLLLLGVTLTFKLPSN